MYNKVFLIGRIVNEPTLKYSQQGKAVSTFSIAVDRTNEETDYFDIVSFDKQAEIASKYLTKGRLVMIEGRIQTRTYESQDGSKRKIYEIIVDNFRMLDKRPDQDKKLEETKATKKMEYEKPEKYEKSEKYEKPERIERKPEKNYQKPYRDFDEFDIDEEFESKSYKSKSKRMQEDDFEDFFFDEN
ncbi:MAG: single-stranded DNA-binding protein [bacterium]